MKGFPLAFTSAFLLVFAGSTAGALPRFATLSGTKCSSCHVDPAGSGMRQAFGLQYGRENLPVPAWSSGTYGGAPTWRELYYNDARAMAARYDRINQMGLYGVGIWVLGYDSGFPELNQVLADKFLTDKNPPLAGIVDMPASQTSESFTVSWTGTDDWNGVASYDLQVSTDAGARGDLWRTTRRPRLREPRRQTRGVPLLR